MKKAVLVLGKIQTLPNYEDVDWIGVDYGAEFLAKKGYSMSMAIGDFDSSKDVELIRAHCRQFISLPRKKDDTDSVAALKHLDFSSYGTVELWGALGGRRDHELVNYGLLFRYPGLVIRSEHQCLRVYPQGKHILSKEFKYISFFAPKPCVLHCQDLVYPLNHLKLDFEDLFACSNEFLKDSIELTVEQGSVLCVQSEDHN